MSVSLRDVKKSYQQGDSTLAVLKGLDLEVASGSLVAVLGSSGSGKSTLLGLLAGLEEPNDGKILVEGQDLYALPEPERTHFRAKSISLVFQQFHLLPHLSALENIHLPLEILGQENLARAEELLNAVGLASRRDHLPSQLSGGECQRVAIARALITKPKLLLADEPSGNLDNDTAKQVMNLFFETVRKEKITCILVTHNEELAAQCEKSYRLQGGKF